MSDSTINKTLAAIDGNGQWSAVRSHADFEAFVRWFEKTDQDSLDGRKAAYEREAGETMGAAVASPLAKARVIARVAGPFLKGLARRANGLAGESLSTGGDGEERAVAASDEVIRLVQRLVSAVSEDICKMTLGESDNLLSKKAIGKLMELAGDRKAFGMAFVSMLALGEEAKALAALGQWKGSVAARTAIKEPKKTLKSCDSGGDVDEGAGMGFYAPLLAFMMETAEPFKKMEMLAKFELYLKTGMASADLIEGRSVESDPERSRRLAEWRSAVADFNSKGGGADRVARAMAERIGDLMLVARVQEHRENGVLLHRVFEHGLGGSFGEAASSGVVDAAMVSDRHPGLVMACFVSSNEYLSTQGDQWYAHMQALKSWVKSRPVVSGQILTEVVCEVMSPSCMPQGKQAKGRWGENVAEFYGHSASSGLSSELRDAVAMAPFLHVLAQSGKRKGFDVSNALELEYSIIGGSASAWGEMRSRSMASANPRDQATVELAKWWAGAVALAAGMGEDKLNELSWVDEGKRGSGMLMFMEELAKIGVWAKRSVEGGDISDQAAKEVKKYLGDSREALERLEQACSEVGGLQAQFENVRKALADWSSDKPALNNAGKNKPL